ncbi:MAG: polysaccharide deacetylase family protein [Candidatus Magasanikbacteria bacterium]
MRYFLLLILMLIFASCGIYFGMNNFFTNSDTFDEEIVINTNTDEMANYIIPAEELEIPILIYHNVREFESDDSEASREFIVTPAEFERQMAYLQEAGFTPIIFGRLYNYFQGQETDWPERPVIITFDDGTKSHYENAFPILQKYNFLATFFIFTNPIGKSKNYLTWEQVEEMDMAGMEFGGHGHYHLYLNKISTQELEQEVVTSKKNIEEKLGKEIISFSYPFGVADDRVLNKVESAGYKVARNITNGTVHTAEDLLNLDGYFVTNDFARFERILGDK